MCSLFVVVVENSSIFKLSDLFFSEILLQQSMNRNLGFRVDFQ